jgi:hypothetical protein
MNLKSKFIFPIKKNYPILILIIKKKLLKILPYQNFRRLALKHFVLFFGDNFCFLKHFVLFLSSISIQSSKV